MSGNKKSFLQRYGEWAIVTGASSGIGEAFAHELAARGVKCLLIARRESELQRVAADVTRQYGVTCETLALDLSSHNFIDKLMHCTADKNIGLIIGNAAYNPAAAFLDMSREMLMHMLDVNDRANLLLAHAFLPVFKARGRGGLLLVSSTESFFGIPYSTCYSATKAFVLSLGEALWGELKSDGVDVLVLAPSATDTPLFASRGLNAHTFNAMPARHVASIGLDHLGKGPYIVPGKLNRWLFRILRRLPRRFIVQVSGMAMKRIVANLRLPTQGGE